MMQKRFLDFSDSLLFLYFLIFVSYLLIE